MRRRERGREIMGAPASSLADVPLGPQELGARAGAGMRCGRARRAESKLLRNRPYNSPNIFSAVPAITMYFKALAGCWCDWPAELAGPACCCGGIWGWASGGCCPGTAESPMGAGPELFADRLVVSGAPDAGCWLAGSPPACCRWTAANCCCCWGSLAATFCSTSTSLPAQVGARATGERVGAGERTMGDKLIKLAWRACTN